MGMIPSQSVSKQMLKDSAIARIWKISRKPALHNSGFKSCTKCYTHRAWPSLFGKMVNHILTLTEMWGLALSHTCEGLTQRPVSKPKGGCTVCHYHFRCHHHHRHLQYHYCRRPPALLLP